MMRCDECGKSIAKIHRNDKGFRYCSTCYARVFKRRNCPKCGLIARLPENNPESICRHCEVKKPCVRCGKTEYKIGKITSYGPVCNVCRPFFIEPKPCGQCGKHSTHLTRVKRLGILVPVCSKCATQDYATCNACKKYRLLKTSSDGRMLCKLCLEKGDINCPTCSQSMPAGLGKQCDTCYWHGLLTKRIRMNCASFSVPKMAKYFEEFGYWLGLRLGEHTAAIKIHRYLVFFTDIESNWKTIPSFPVLLNYFGTNKLRKVLLPMQWMEEVGYIVADEKLKLINSENRRIENILDKLSDCSNGIQIINNYHKRLIEKLSSGKTSLRSIRLALSPAVALMVMANKMECVPPQQIVLNKYLEKAPGQLAAISGFVTYLKNYYEVDIILPKANSPKLALRRKSNLESELLALMKNMTNNDYREDKIYIRKWLSVAMAYFHGLPKNIGKKVKDKDILLIDNNEIKVLWDNKIYWIPFGNL